MRKYAPPEIKDAAGTYADLIRRYVGARLAGRGLAHTVSWVTEQSPVWQCLHVWEAPVFTERTSVGLDVHARSVVAAAIDGDTGEVFRKRLTPATTT